MLQRQNAASVFDAVAEENNEHRSSILNLELKGTGLRFVLYMLKFFSRSSIFMRLVIHRSLHFIL